ncbi:MAG: hypothetical protein AAFV93_18490, partial [Chloroflexota bacterium]
MPTPQDLLRAILVELDAIPLDNKPFNAQQVTFMQHIRNTTDALLTIFDPMPQSAYALQRIVPGMSDSLLQQEVALFGYARLLLEHPDSFDGAVVPEPYRAPLERIYQLGQQLHRLMEQIQQEALINRRQQQSAPATHFNLTQLFTDDLPILQYLLRDYPIQITATIKPLDVCFPKYHLIEFIQHIVLTLTHDLIEYGHIKISTSDNSLIIFCTGIQLTQTEIETLFKKQGRYIYPRRFERSGGNINFTREQGRGASIVL